MMRSRSRSRSRRHQLSRTASHGLAQHRNNDRASHGLAQHRNNDRNRSNKGRSRSASRTRRGAASKRKSDAHRGASASLKRRRSDPEKGAKQREVPRKREADSTDSPAKVKHVGDSQSQRRPMHRASDKKEKRKHSDKSTKRRRDSVEEGEIDESQSVERPFDQTEMSLDDRFTSLSKTKPFVPDENVTIEIERSVAGRAVPFAIPPFWSDAVQILRRSDEGKKPLNDREEFLQRDGSDEDERRVVKVKKSSVPGNFDIRREKVPAERRSGLSSKDGRSRRSEPSRRVEESRRGSYGTTRRTEAGSGSSYQDNIGLVVTRNRGDNDGRSR